MTIVKHTIIFINSSSELRYMLKSIATNLDEEPLNCVLEIEGRKMVKITKQQNGAKTSTSVLISMLRKSQGKNAKEMRDLLKYRSTDYKLNILTYPQNNKLIQEELKELIETKHLCKINLENKSQIFYTYSYYLK